MIYAVICAAGAGTRMGQSKALCHISNAKTFLSSIVDTLRQCGIIDIVVVLGAEHEKVRAFHRDLPVRWVYNQQWQTTFMLESLVCGLEHVPAGTDVIHWPVDCLFIHPEDLNRLIAQTGNETAVLSWDGVPGHPVLLGKDDADELRRNSGSYRSLREFVESRVCMAIEAAYPALLNCNSPDMLEQFLSGNKLI